MVVEPIGNGYVRLTNPGGRVVDTRTNRKYREVVCSERNVRYFGDA